MPSEALQENCVEREEKTFTLRCFVYPQRNGLYVAECIDLDLIVKARKPKEAMKGLRDAMLGYVKVAVESGQEGVLIPRPAPLTHRLRYHFIGFALHFANLRKSQIYSCTQKAHSRCFA